MMDDNMINDYQGTLGRVLAYTEQINQFLQMNEIRYESIVLSVLRTPLQDLPIPRRVKVMRIISALWKNTRNIVQKTSRFYDDSVMLANKFRMIRDVQWFLNEPFSLHIQTSDIIEELKAVIERLKRHREIIDEVLNYYRA